MFGGKKARKNHTGMLIVEAPMKPELVDIFRKQILLASAAL